MKRIHIFILAAAMVASLCSCLSEETVKYDLGQLTFALDEGFVEERDESVAEEAYEGACSGDMEEAYDVRLFSGTSCIIMCSAVPMNYMNGQLDELMEQSIKHMPGCEVIDETGGKADGEEYRITVYRTSSTGESENYELDILYSGMLYSFNFLDGDDGSLISSLIRSGSDGGDAGREASMEMLTELASTFSLNRDREIQLDKRNLECGDLVIPVPGNIAELEYRDADVYDTLGMGDASGDEYVETVCSCFDLSSTGRSDIGDFAGYIPEGGDFEKTDSSTKYVTIREGEDKENTECIYIEGKSDRYGDVMSAVFQYRDMTYWWMSTSADMPEEYLRNIFSEISAK